MGLRRRATAPHTGFRPLLTFFTPVHSAVKKSRQATYYSDIFPLTRLLSFFIGCQNDPGKEQNLKSPWNFAISVINKYDMACGKRVRDMYIWRLLIFRDPSPCQYQIHATPLPLVRIWLTPSPPLSADVICTSYITDHKNQTCWFLFH